jgi:hypothetical protein
MPFYVVTTKGEEAKRLIKAPSSAAAVKHCAEDKYSTDLITTIDEAAPHFEAGVKLEKVGEES